MNRIDRSLVLLFLVGFALGPGAMLQAVADNDTAPASMAIETQPLSKALLAFSEKTGLQIGYASKLVAGKDSGDVENLDDPGQALDQLLAPTGLNYEFVNEKTVVIRAVVNARRPKPAVLQNSHRLDEEVLFAALQESSQPVAESDRDEEEASEEEEEVLELGEHRVTGSRLIGGDPSALVYSFTAEEISRRGVSSLEDLFRTLPWHFSTQNTQTGMARGQSERSRRSDALQFRDVDVGVATANLRALGSRNTLVLRDGRRIAGVGGVEEDIVNLLDVPLSAIERVDIQLDGASAVYGADAIGGVVNFITKKDYQGLAVSSRYEISSSGADTARSSITGGYAWGTGKMTAILSHRKTKPVLNRKLGWTTMDLRPMLGVDFDRRPTTVQPGVVCVLHYRDYLIHSCYPPYVPGAPRMPLLYYQLPPDHSGENAQISDFLAMRFSETPRHDDVPRQNGVDGTMRSLQVAVEQDVTRDLRVYAAVNWVDSKSYREYRYLTQFFDIPASNAYNPFGAPVRVRWMPTYEFDNGLLPPPHDRSEDESRTINLGFYWTFFGAHELNLDINRTKSWRESAGFSIKVNPVFTDPTSAAFYEALASPDPARALNVFGNGTVQGSAFDEFIRPDAGPYNGVTETRQYNLTLRGKLFGMWGGAATYSLGGEHRENIVFYDRPSYSNIVYDDEWLYTQNSLAALGLARPSRETAAYYAEFAFPFFGKTNARRGVQSLILTAQARWDVDDAYGSFGGRETNYRTGRSYYYEVFEDYALKYNEGRYWSWDIFPNIEKVRDSRVSPRLGIHYEPTDTLTFRAAWSRSYVPPRWGLRFSTGNPYRSRFFGVDPYAPGGPRVYNWGSSNVRVTNLTFVDDLDPEYSTNWSGSLHWLPNALPGFRFRLDWSAVDYNNRIRSSRSLIRDFPEVVMNNPEIAERDNEGNLVRVYYRNINIENRYSEMATAHVEYAFDTRVGRFMPAVQYTRYLEDYEQLTKDTPEISALGTQRGQDRYRWQFSVNWRWRKFQADVWAYYTPGYLNDRAHSCPLYPSDVREGSPCTGSWSVTGRSEYLTIDVASLTTIDATVSYTMDNGLRIRAGGRNVLDRSFPLTVNGTSGFVPYDAGRWDARGRVLFIDLNWQM